MKSALHKVCLLFFSLSVSLLAVDRALSIIHPQSLSGSWREQTVKGLFVNKSHGAARHQFGNRVVGYSFVAPHLRGPLHSGSVRVLVLGDSFTFGWLLDDRHNYVGLLQGNLDRDFGIESFSLLNAAAGGWGTADYLAYIEDFGEEVREEVRPDFVLVFLNTDDIGRSLRSPLWEFNAESGVLTRSLVPIGRLKRLTNAAPGYQWLLEHSHLIQIARKTMLVSISDAPAGDESKSVLASEMLMSGPHSDTDVDSALHGRALGAALFTRLNSWCERHDAYLAITTTGWFPQPLTTQSDPTQAFLAGADALFAKLDVPFSDPSAQLWHKRIPTRQKFVIPGDGHPNEAGAALIVEHVYPFVESQLSRYCQLMRGPVIVITRSGHRDHLARSS